MQMLLEVFRKTVLCLTASCKL